MAHTAHGAFAANTASSSDPVDELHLLDFPADMTMQQLADGEVGYDELWGPKRRLALISLARSKAELVDGFSKSDNGPEVLMDMIEHVQDWMQHLQACIAIGESAHARLSVTCATVIKQAEANRS